MPHIVGWHTQKRIFLDLLMEGRISALRQCSNEDLSYERKLLRPTIRVRATETSQFSPAPSYAFSRGGELRSDNQIHPGNEHP